MRQFLLLEDRYLHAAPQAKSESHHRGLQRLHDAYSGIGVGAYPWRRTSKDALPAESSPETESRSPGRGWICAVSARTPCADSGAAQASVLLSPGRSRRHTRHTTELLHQGLLRLVWVSGALWCNGDLEVRGGGGYDSRGGAPLNRDRAPHVISRGRVRLLRPAPVHEQPLVRDAAMAHPTDLPHRGGEGAREAVADTEAVARDDAAERPACEELAADAHEREGLEARLERHGDGIETERLWPGQVRSKGK